ncbi:hypothetical protein HPB49_013295 [Dermacentor silvarum]|uniref:Uncharacterized protein n=1 Tax=Dermacentor silvarum TaxID=543639 RepID=A0ACB8CL86_DERSI|nr:hypothetical protein HPB49_013295 [Dermacentor silvarum]
MDAFLYTVMELIDTDSEDEETDTLTLLCQVGVHLIRSDRNRFPNYYEYVVSRFCEFEFTRLFRLSQDTFESLARRYESPHFFQTSQGGRPQIPAGKTCLMVLSYLGSQNSMHKINDTFDLSESSVPLRLSRVMEFFSISAEVISWPTGAEREGFLSGNEGQGLSNTIECLDGSHIEILKQKESSSSYLNRKKFPSAILRGIRDARSHFTDVYVGFPGSAHDPRVLRHSPFF